MDVAIMVLPTPTGPSMSRCLLAFMVARAFCSSFVRPTTPNWFWIFSISCILGVLSSPVAERMMVWRWIYLLSCGVVRQVFVC